MNGFRMALPCLLSMTMACACAAAPTPNPTQAQAAHAQGSCGSLGPGTGLAQGKGWIVSMIPGVHEVRVAGQGEAFLTAARARSWDFDAGRPYYIVVEKGNASSALEWKVPGKGWEAVPTTFLYPPQGVSYAK